MRAYRQRVTRGFRWKSILVGLCVLLFLAAFIALGMNDQLGESCTEIDINSGRMRHRITMLGMVLSEEVEETEFSRAVSRHGLATEPACYKSAFGKSVGPQQFFGNAIWDARYGFASSNLRSIMLVFKINPELQTREREIVARALELLKSGRLEELRAFDRSLDDL